MTNQEAAARAAEAIKSTIMVRTGNGGPGRRITHATFVTSYQLHVVLEALAKEFAVDSKEFKAACGVGQPLAYFI